MSDETERPGTPGDDDEGVRLLGADEAARASEREDVAQRLPEGQPRFGDRPPELVGGQPAMSFPLAADADPTQIERPKPKGGSLFARKAAADAGPSPSGALPPPTSAPVDRPPPAAEPAPAATGPSAELPPWTDPPTGEVPTALGGSGDEPVGGWAAAASQPRWKDQAGDWDDADVTDMGDVTRAATPDEVPAGDERPRPVPTGRAPGERPRLATAGPGGGGRDVQQAAVVGIGLAVAFLVLVAYKPGAAMLMVVGVLVVSAAEFFAAVRKPGFQPPTLLGLVAVAALPLGVFYRGEQAIGLVLFLTVVFGMLWYVAGISTERPVANLAVTFLGVLWIGFLGSYAALMLTVPDDGGGLLIGAVLVTVAHDVAGFFGGSTFGRTPLSKLSPNKTVEGLVAGMIGSIVTGALVVFTVPWLDPFGAKFSHALLLGIVGGIAAPLGDLAQSMIKRDLRIKDMGSVLPGHGGVLDRFDGMLFVLPAVWYLARFLDLV